LMNVSRLSASILRGWIQKRPSNRRDFAWIFVGKLLRPETDGATIASPDRFAAVIRRVFSHARPIWRAVNERGSAMKAGLQWKIDESTTSGDDFETIPTAPSVDGRSELKRGSNYSTHADCSMRSMKLVWYLRFQSKYIRMPRTALFGNFVISETSLPSVRCMAPQ